MGVKSFVKGLATGAVVGAAVGVATGLLSAPKSGKKLRAEIMNYAEDMRKDLMKMLGRAQNVTKEVYDDAVEQVMASYKNIKEMTQDEIQDLRNMLMQEWEMVAKKFKKN